MEIVSSLRYMKQEEQVQNVGYLGEIQKTS